MQYALIDIVRAGYELEQIRPLASLWLSLYRGPEDTQQEEMAPCLVGYEVWDAFANWFSQAGEVGIGLETEATPDELYKHLRRFLMVELEGTGETPSRSVYFRYYDPDVLRVFLPTCDEVQLTTFFGPIRAFLVVARATGERLRFTRQRDQLRVQSVALSA